MTKKVRDVLNLLELNGWRQVRIRGDHRIYYKEGARRPIVVPGNMNDDLAFGTLKSILKEAGIQK
ncbi:MAG: type II toxin-antitoxin system HicA family toxin [Bacteroidales bacterium]|nr:type II toxin-antitoxin system HicA family toxin [Bacteroidales bacterium]